MSDIPWYYVEDGERIGPVPQSELVDLIRAKKLDGGSYVWKKGFSDWTKLSALDDFKSILNGEEPELDLPPMIEEDVPPVFEPSIDLDSISFDERIFSIKVGQDRGSDEKEFGPYSINILKKLYSQKRLNDRTLLFAVGMSNWESLINFKYYSEISGKEPSIEESLNIEMNNTDKRDNNRKPFIARILFHDKKEVYEGICRDISAGGLQVLVANFPGDNGEQVILNVHPQNNDQCFTAKGEIVRMLPANAGFALKFIEIKPEFEEAIKDYTQV